MTYEEFIEKHRDAIGDGEFGGEDMFNDIVEMDLPGTVDDLRTVNIFIDSRIGEIQSVIHDRLSKLRSELEAELLSVVAEQRRRVNRAIEPLVNSQLNRRIEEARKDPACGRIVFELKRVGFSYASKQLPSGVRGVIDVWTKDSDCPLNVSRKPMIGELYIRILKKDGTPSSKFHINRSGFSETFQLESGWQYADASGVPLKETSKTS